jgi:hypothetical protein
VANKNAQLMAPIITQTGEKVDTSSMSTASLLEFRCGLMRVEGSRLVPDTRHGSGHLVLEKETRKLMFQWRPALAKETVELEFSVDRDDAFEKLKQAPPGSRVYGFRLRSAGQRFLLWLQQKADAAADELLCSQVQRIIVSNNNNSSNSKEDDNSGDDARVGFLIYETEVFGPGSVFVVLLPRLADGKYHVCDHHDHIAAEVVQLAALGFFEIGESNFQAMLGQSGCPPTRELVRELFIGLGWHQLESMDGNDVVQGD